MAQSSNLIPSVLKCKCPKCQEGNLFINKNIYAYKGYFDMPNNCPKCGQDFQIEAGFYLGAMFVSYACTVALTIAVFVAFTTFNAFSLVPFLIASTITLILTTPYILKISRSIWISFSVRFDPNAITNYAAQNTSK